MKASHSITPRTLGECQFAMNADPIERYEQSGGHRFVDRLIAAVCIAAVPFVTWLAIWR